MCAEVYSSVQVVRHGRPWGGEDRLERVRAGSEGRWVPGEELWGDPGVTQANLRVRMT